MILIQGNTDQSDSRFLYGGKQCTPISVIACVRSTLKALSEWTASDIDTCLQDGDLLYGMSLQSIERDYEGDNEYMQPHELAKEIVVGNEQIIYSVDLGVFGYLLAETNKETGHFELQEGLTTFFRYNRCGIFTTDGYSIALMKDKVSDDGKYYILDPHKRNACGLKDDEGVSIIYQSSLSAGHKKQVHRDEHAIQGGHSDRPKNSVFCNTNYIDQPESTKIIKGGQFDRPEKSALSYTRGGHLDQPGKVSIIRGGSSDQPECIGSVNYRGDHSGQPKSTYVDSSIREQRLEKNLDDGRASTRQGNFHLMVSKKRKNEELKMRMKRIRESNEHKYPVAHSSPEKKVAKEDIMISPNSLENYSTSLRPIKTKHNEFMKQYERARYANDSEYRNIKIQKSLENQNKSLSNVKHKAEHLKRVKERLEQDLRISNI